MRTAPTIATAFQSATMGELWVGGVATDHHLTVGEHLGEHLAQRVKTREFPRAGHTTGHLSATHAHVSGPHVLPCTPSAQHGP